MPAHVNTLGLADALRDFGVNVWELGPGSNHKGNWGWQQNQEGYYWCRFNDAGKVVHSAYEGIPVGASWHHTVSTAYTPYVKNPDGQTKACGWGGVRLGNRLYQAQDSTEGLAVYALASAGPANYSNGKNNNELIKDYLPNDRQFHGPQRKADTPGFYGNRFTWTTEMVCRGYGTAEQMRLRDDVYEMIINAGVAMSQFFGWTHWRHGGHYDLTSRKIDIQISNKNSDPYSIEQIQEDVRLMMGGGMGCPWRDDVDKGHAWYSMYPPCAAHYNKDSWGNASTGVCNVPDWMKDAVDWAVNVKRIRPLDDHRDDMNTFLTDGRYTVIEHRAAGSP